MTAVSLGLMMIIKNEEKNLPRSLLPLMGSCDQAVVADTGSGDNGPAEAAQAGAEVFSFAWQDDFSAARNFALSKMRTDYVLWLDGDNSLDPKALVRFRRRLTPEPQVWLAWEKVVPQGDLLLQKRLFPNRPGAGWQGAVHEQLVHPPSWPQAASPLVIEHWGYNDPRLAREKGERNLRLLLKTPLSENSDYYSLYQAGRTLFSLRRFEEAVPWLELASRKDGNPSLAAHAAILLAQIHQKAGRPVQAAAGLEELTARQPAYGPGHYSLGRLLAESDPLRAARELALALELDLSDPAWGACGEKLGYTAAFVLGGLLKESDPARAGQAWLRAGQLAPGRPEPWVELARLAASLNRPAEVRKHAARALAVCPGFRPALKLLNEAQP